jgi:hypothetical protein
MIDNLPLLEPLLKFTEPLDFYMLYILQRKKDQSEEERTNHQSVRTIKSYCIESIEYLEKRYDEIKTLCETFKARAYIHIQRQNHKDVSLEMMVALAERIKNGNQNQKGLFDSVVGQMKTYEKRWVVDIDNTDEDLDRAIQEYINTKCKPFGMKILANIPTKNGHHLITERFDVMEFRKGYPDIDIQKKNPTLLYLPNSLHS